MMVRCRRKSRVLYWGPLTILFLLGWLVAQEPARAPETLKFRRVYLPADRVEEWPLGKYKYRPTDPKEFEDFVKLLSPSQAGPTQAASRLVQASYQARLEGDVLVDGRAAFNIEAEADTESILLLHPCRLALDEVRWNGQEDAPASLGLTAENQTAVFVPQAGKLTASWSLRGRRQSVESLEFNLEIPKAPVSTLSLDLPQSLTLLSDVGVVIGPLPSKRAKHQRWRLELGGHHTAKLKVTLGESSGQNKGITLLRETLTYDFSLRGLEVSAKLDLETLNRPRQTIELELDPGLRLIAARFDDIPLDWTVVSPDRPAAKGRVVLQLPEPILGTGRVLSIKALAPLVLDSSWRLPGLRMLDTFWQEGQATLRIPAPLVLKQLNPVTRDGQLTCRQIEASPLPAPDLGESVVVQYYAEDAAVDVQVRRRGLELLAIGGTSLSWGTDEISGTAIVDLELPDGKLFQLSAQCPKEWLIDSVTTVPTDVLADWSYHPRREGSNELRLQLSRALTPERSLRLVVRGRLLRPPPETPLPIDELRLLHLPAAQISHWRMAVQTSGPYRLELSNPHEVQRLNPAALEVDWRHRLMRGSIHELLELPPHGSTAKLALVPEKPRFSAEVHVLATANNYDTLTEEFRIRCTPETGHRLRNLRVQLATRQPHPPEWMLIRDGETLPLDGARRIADGESGELWEFSLSRPSTGPLELRGRRVVALGETEQPVLTVSLPDATEQHGALLVRCLGEQPAAIINRGLAPIPVPAASEDPAGSVRAAFRFEETIRADSGDASEVVLVPPSQQNQPAVASAVVWRSDTTIRSGAGGSAAFRTSFLLQNFGLEELDVQLPQAVHSPRVWVGPAEQPPEALAKPGQLIVPLPSDQRFVSVSVEYEAQQPLRVLQWTRPQVPTVPVPVLSSGVHVSLPPGFEIRELSSGWSSPQVEPKAWTQRLFGPLARSAEILPFNPLRASDWTALARREEPVRPASAGPLWQQLADRAAEMSPDATWSEMFDALADAAERPLMLDATGLARAGIGPQDRVAGGENGNVLRRFTLLVTPQAVLLTPTAEIVRFRSELKATAGHVFAVQDSWVSRAIEDPAARFAAGFLPPEAWSRTQFPQGSAAGSTPPPQLVTSWDYHLSGALGKPLAFRIVQVEAFAAWTWGTFLLCVAVGSWFGRKRLTPLVLGLGLSTTAALVVPATFVPIASSAVLGFSAYLIWRVAIGGQILPWKTAEDEQPRPALVAASLSVALVVATSLFSAPSSRGQEGNAAKQPEEVVYPVFIPIDKNKKPIADEKYLVPLEFYKQLRQRADQLKAKPQGWLLGQARYQGTVSWDAVDKKFLVPQITAHYKLQVLDGTSRIDLPFGAEGLWEVPDTLTLNGREIPLRWKRAEGLASFRVPGSGRYLVAIALRPRARLADGKNLIDLKIPPVPQAHLGIALPPQAPQLEVTSAFGAQTLGQKGRALRVSLGSAERLTIGWQEGDTGEKMTGEVKVEQLGWLRISPGSAVLDLRLNIQAEQGSVRRINLTADPRLRLLRLRQQDELPELRIRDVGGSPRTYELTFAHPASGTFPIEARFLLEGTSGVGNLRLPNISVGELPVEKKWLGVSVDRSLEVVQAKGNEIPAEDFSRAWGPTTVKTPVYKAYRLPDEPEQASLWSLSTRPREPIKEAEQTLRLVVKSRSIHVEFVASILTSAAPSFHHRLAVPERLDIHQITVEQDGVVREVRWTRDGPDSVTVLLGTPTGMEPQQLVLEGSFPIGDSPAVAAPMLAVQKASLTSSRLSINRRAGIRVSVKKLDGWKKMPAASESTNQGEFAVGRFEATKESLAKRNFAAIFNVSQNEPQVRAVQVTSLIREQERWLAEVDFRIRQVEAGSVDLLRFEIPDTWQGPFEITPELPYELVRLPAERTQLIIRPLRTVSGSYQLKIRSPLTISSGSRVTAPAILPQGINRLQTFLVLPTQFDLQQASWNVFGLRPDELPDDVQMPLPGSYQSYRIVSRRFGASLRGLDQTSRLPRVWLADHLVGLREDNSYVGVTRLHLEPGGRTSCILATPPECELYQLQLDGRPAVVTASSEGGWSIDLGPARYPRRIDVFYSGRLVRRGWTRAGLPVPRVLDFPVERTLWTIRGLDPRSLTSAGLELARPEAAELARLENLVRLTDLTTRFVADEPTAEVAAWYRPWSDWISHSASRLAPYRASGAALPAELTSLEALRDEWQTRIELAEQDEAVPLSWNIPGDAVWQTATGPQQHTVTVSLAESRDTLLLDTRYLPGGGRFWHWLAALSVLAGTIGLAMWVARGPGHAWFVRWCHGWGVALGLFWWLWLSPSPLGWLIIGLTLWSGFRGPWKRRRSGSPSSIIHLVSRD